MHIEKGNVGRSLENMLDAAIMRVMKRMKRSHHKELYITCKIETKNLFSFEKDMMTNRIAHLIEKGFIAVDSSDPQFYTYVD